MQDVEQEYDEVPQQSPDEPAEVGIDASLAGWMQERRQAREQDQTELFPVSPFGERVQVELRAVGFKRLRAIRRYHEKKTRDDALRDIYGNADAILAATVGFHVLQDGVIHPVAAVDATWRAIATKANPHLGDSVTDRQAMLNLLGDIPLTKLAGDYLEWASNRGEDDDLEADQDLLVTR